MGEVTMLTGDKVYVTTNSGYGHGIFTSAKKAMEAVEEKVRTKSEHKLERFEYWRETEVSRGFGGNQKIKAWEALAVFFADGHITTTVVCVKEIDIDELNESAW